MLSIMLLSAAAIAAQPVDYRVSVTGGSKPAVSIELSFVGEADGETSVELPTHWAGSDELWKGLGPPLIRGGRRVQDADPTHWHIAHAPGARVTVRYALLDRHPGVPDASDYAEAQPVIQPDWFQILDQSAIAFPVGRENAPARFRWGHAPKGWKVASDLEAPSTPLTVQGVAEGVMIGGAALRISERDLGGPRLRVAMLGRWPYDDAALTERIAKLIPTENAMLDAPAVPYLVTLMPLTGSATGAMNHGGTGRTAGFALFSTDNISLDLLTRTLAHEHAHRWFGHAFGSVPDGAGPYWFTEGVNDWFAARAMVASGLWAMKDWVHSLNEVLLRYDSSTARKLSDADITERFWTDPDAMQVQYDRGHLTALLLDRQIDGGLIPILRIMAATPDPADEPTRFTALVDARVPDAVNTARLAVAEPLPPALFAPCGTLETLTQPNYERGYDADASRHVTAVRTAAAREAGITVGMQVVKRLAVTPGDSRGIYTVRFADATGEHEISWYPRGERKVTFQQLAPNALESDECRSLIAGVRIAP